MSQAFTTVLADVAWEYNDKLRQSDTLRSSKDQYKSTMSVPDACALWDREMRTLAGFDIAPDAFLWFWTTNPMLLDGSATTVIRAWNFVPKQLITWVKGRVAYLDAPREAKLVLQTGLGHYTRGVTEHMILATRGRCKDLVVDRGQNNVIVTEEGPLPLDQTVLVAKRGRHSEKPQEAYRLIENVCVGPYLELFARQPRNGWTSWGNELV